MVSKKVPAHTWSFQSHGQRIASLHMQLADKEVTIINVYNPRSNGPRIQTWDTIQQAIHLVKGKIILLGDFNAHHPSWGGPQAAHESQSDHLHTAATTNGLLLLTPCRLPTWRRGVQQSVIDLTFASEAIERVVQFCGPVDQWATMQDHIPIDIHISIRAPKPAPSRQYAMEKLDKEGLWQHLNQSNWIHASCQLTALQQTLQKDPEKHCPKARPCVHTNPQWSPRALELLASAR